MPNADVWAVEVKYGLAPKVNRYFHQICDDIGAVRRYVVYGGDDEFPIGNDAHIVSLEKLMRKLRALG